MIKKEWRPKIPCQNRVHTLIFELLQNGGKHVGRHKDRWHSRIACQIWGHVTDNSTHGRLQAYGLRIDPRRPAARARQWHQPGSDNDKDLGICILMER
tara:strand:+ start:851 stop:1144 length:294 start_codon:yes stop_codon:yes gene_type:complete